MNRLFALFCCILCLPGCLQTAAPDLDAFVTNTPHAFTAQVVFSATGDRGYVNLSGPVQVADRDGTLVDAYVYEQVVIVDGKATHRLWYYLDGALRRVADALGCGYILISCDDLLRWSWNDQGAPGPDGLGYPALIASGDLTNRAGGNVTPIPHSMDFDDHGRLLLHVESWAQAKTSLAYRYMAGRGLPDGGRLQVEKFEDLGPLPKIEALPVPLAPLAPASWNGLMFVGENEDTFGVGHSHADIVAFAFPPVTTDKEVCIQRYELSPRVGPNETLPLPRIGSPDGPTSTATVVAINGTTQREVQVRIERDSVTGRASMSRLGGPSSPAPFTCAEARQSPWPDTSIEELLVAAQESLHHKHVEAFTHELGLRSRSVSLSPAHGWHTARFDLTPQAAQGGTGLYSPYTVTFETSGLPATVWADAPLNASFAR